MLAPSVTTAAKSSWRKITVDADFIWRIRHLASSENCGQPGGARLSLITLLIRYFYSKTRFRLAARPRSSQTQTLSLVFSAKPLLTAAQWASQYAAIATRAIALFRNPQEAREN